MRGALTWGLLALSLLLAAAPASAQDATQQAKALFNVGAQAYEGGQFPAAIQALGEAYRLSPRPGILFSLAQAHRKQYYVDRQPAQIRRAVALYREYVAKVETGGRRSDAVQALAEFEPIAEKLGADVGPATAPAVEKKAATRLMVSTQTKEATIALDGGKPVEAPLIAEVTPGKHTLQVAAAGYFPEEREVQAAEGGVVALDLTMREQPGLLVFTARDGANVSIDGRVAGTTPLPRPIEVPAGVHFVTVTRRGCQPFSEDLEIGRGETKTLTAPLEVTRQRVGAQALFGVAAAGLVAGGVLAGFALFEQGQAKTLDNRRTQTGALSLADLTQYNSYVSTRNDVRTAAAVAFGGAAAVGVTAVLLAIFDLPAVDSGVRRDDRVKPVAPTPRDRPMELSAAPLAGPGLYGAALTGRF